MVVRRKVVLGLVVLLCVVVLGYVMFTKEDKEEDTKPTTDATVEANTPSTRKLVIGFIGSSFLVLLLVQVFVKYRDYQKENNFVDGETVPLVSDSGRRPASGADNKVPVLTAEQWEAFRKDATHRYEKNMQSLLEKARKYKEAENNFI